MSEEVEEYEPGLYYYFYLRILSLLDRGEEINSKYSLVRETSKHVGADVILILSLLSTAPAVGFCKMYGVSFLVAALLFIISFAVHYYLLEHSASESSVKKEIAQFKSNDKRDAALLLYCVFSIGLTYVLLQ